MQQESTAALASDFGEEVNTDVWRPQVLGDLLHTSHARLDVLCYTIIIKPSSFNV